MSELNFYTIINWMFDGQDIPGMPVQEAPRTISNGSTIQGITTVQF